MAICTVGSERPIEEQIEAWQIYFATRSEGSNNAHKRALRRTRRRFPWFIGPRASTTEGEKAKRFIAAGFVVVPEPAPRVHPAPQIFIEGESRQ